MELWRNNKNGKIYELLSIVVDQTNARQGTNMVLYRSPGMGIPLHVRDQSEFEVKFTKVVEPETPDDRLT